MTDLFARLPRDWQRDRYEQMIDAERDRDRFPAYYAACVANYRLTTVARVSRTVTAIKLTGADHDQGI